MATISRSGIAASSTISATHITNIIDALDGIGVTTIVATGSFSGSFRGSLVATGSFSGSFSGSFRGNLTGTSSWASNATLATTASHAIYATSAPFTGLTGLPAAIYNNGVTSVQQIDYSTPNSASVLVNGTFYQVSGQGGGGAAVGILLDAGAIVTGTEFTFFATNVDNPIIFRTGSGADTIISENGYLSMYGTGSAVTAKLISTSPVVWALIGSLKA